MSVWDSYAHARSRTRRDEETGDVACDSYNKIKDDIVLLKNLGVRTTSRTTHK